MKIIKLDGNRFDVHTYPLLIVTNGYSVDLCNYSRGYNINGKVLPKDTILNLTCFILMGAFQNSMIPLSSDKVYLI
jgi:hypothetical protein